ARVVQQVVGTTGKLYSPLPGMRASRLGGQYDALDVERWGGGLLRDQFHHVLCSGVAARVLRTGTGFVGCHGQNICRAMSLGKALPNRFRPSPQGLSRVGIVSDHSPRV